MKDENLIFKNKVNINMYPEMESPTSPQDVPMNEPKILSKRLLTPSPPAMLSSTSHLSSPYSSSEDDEHQQLFSKSSETLRNNIDAKDEVNKKRTSLNLENSSSSVDNIDIIGKDDNDCDHKLRQHSLTTINSTNLDSNKRSSDHFITDIEKSINNNDVYSSDCDNTSTAVIINSPIDNKIYQRNSVADDNNDEDDYNDMDNGNSSTDTDTQKRDSLTSRESSEIYFFCEKFKNTLNANSLQNAVQLDAAAMELLSPNEGPMSRRYAEIAHFKSSNPSLNNNNVTVTR